MHQPRVRYFGVLHPVHVPLEVTDQLGGHVAHTRPTRPLPFGQERRQHRAAFVPQKSVGEWNHEEVTCRDGAISCEINGSLVDKGTGAMPDHGPIGWQSEGGKIRFRNLMLQELD